MKRDDMRQVLYRFMDAWNRQDLDGLEGCYSDEAVMRDIAFDLPLQGLDAMRDAASAYFTAFPDLEMIIRRVTCENDVLVAEWHATGTHGGSFMGVRATGRQLEVDGCNVFTFSDDCLIETAINYWDVAGVLHQLGVAPEPAHRVERPVAD
jgi:steroid delta-isomerase-like uncharacterized protein